MSTEVCLATGKPFDSLWDDDGNAFVCSECGASTPRTRMNPYPTMSHANRPTKPKRRKAGV